MKIKCVFILFITNVKTKHLENKQMMEQCGISELEENIKEFRLLEPRIFLPTLKEIKKQYRGDRFIDTLESECSDIELEELCRFAAKSGSCNGTNHEVD